MPARPRSRAKPPMIAPAGAALLVAAVASFAVPRISRPAQNVVALVAFAALMAMAAFIALSHSGL